MEPWPIDSDLQGYRSVPPEPRAAVLLLHGFGEHAARHTATTRAFTQSGIAVYAYDQRGHGRSPGRRGLVPRFEHLVDDSLAMRERVARLHPGLPLILMGVSMGGVLAVRSAQREPRDLDGVVLIAPAFSIGSDTSRLTRLLGEAISALVPGMPIATLELAALSRERSVIDAYAADPLVHHGGVPARTATELIGAAATALQGAPAWQLPTLIVHGDADRIAAPDGAQRFATAACATDVTLTLVPGGYHEPLSERGGEELTELIAGWIVACKRRSPHPRSGSVSAARASRRVFTWREGLAFGAAVNVLARVLGTNTGRYETIERPWFAPPGWVFPIAWGINSAASIWANVHVLNAPPSADRTAYLRLWSATWLLYVLFGYVFFRRKSPLLGYLVTVNFLALTLLSAGRAQRIERRLLLSYVTLLPWLVLATAVAASVALTNSDPLLDPGGPPSPATAPPLEIDMQR